MSRALVLALLCLGGAARAEPVAIGSKKFTESVILGEVLTQAATDAGVPAVHRAELGGTRIAWEALLRGDIDAYADYTGTIAEELLGAATADEDALRAALAARGVTMSRSLGFDDSYALGMVEARARALGVSTLSELAAHPEVRLGLSDEFLRRRDGWPGLRDRYRMPQGAVRPLDHDVAYRALAAGAVDVIDLYTTDPEIRARSLRVLADDRGYFPVYRAVVLSRSDLATRAPRMPQVIAGLEGKITQAAMIGMNEAAQLRHEPERQVAGAFLGHRPEPRSRARRVLARTREHLGLVAVSLLVAVLIGIPLGILAARRRRVGRALLVLVGIVQTIPSLALLVALIPLLGIGATPALVALFLYSLLPIVRGTHDGLVAIPRALRESADVLGLTGLARLRRVELPLAARSILSGVKTAAVIDVGTATLGALVGAGGYGQPILAGIRLQSASLLLEGALPAAVLALLVEAIFELLEPRLISRGLRA